VRPTLWFVVQRTRTTPGSLSKRLSNAESDSFRGCGQHEEDAALAALRSGFVPRKVEHLVLWFLPHRDVAHLYPLPRESLCPWTRRVVRRAGECARRVDRGGNADRGAFVSAEHEIRLDKRPITSIIVVMLWSWRLPRTHPTVTFIELELVMRQKSSEVTIVSLSGLFLTRQEAAEVAGTALSTVDRCIRDGELPHKRIRGRVLIPKAAFLRWCGETNLDSGLMGVAA
jgi:excisionase family DNA binding protein